MSISQFNIIQISRTHQVEPSDILVWCASTFGEEYKNGVPVWEAKISRNIFSGLFIYDDDLATLFALRWV